MASVPRSGSVQPNNTQPESPPTLSWEGERMFNIYILDYCNKRGFRKTARELMNEADIPPDSSPPINARQGLLFEWWSVFWVLFTAKANGRGPEEAMLYTQHQAQRAAQRLQGPPGPQIHPPGQQPQPPMPQHPPAPSRLPNGMTTAGQRFMPNGPMPNGVGHGPGPGPMPPTGPTAFPMGTSGLQPNGIVGPPGAPPTGAVPGSQPQNFPQMMPGQRPPPHVGGPQPGQQPQRGGPVFQSPTMPNAPQNPPGPPQQHQQGQPPNQHPPMGQLGMGSPHLNNLNRGMMPPNIPQGLNPMNPNQQGGLGAPSQFQAGRPPSRTATPGQGQGPSQGGMMHLSPSIAARQPPGVGPGGTPLIRQDQLMNEFMSIPQNAMQQMKQDLGLGDKDISLLSPNEKHRIVTMYRNRFARKSGPESMAAGPSNPMMQPPNIHQRNPQQQPQPPPPQQQQQVQQQRNKRNSTSPGQEHDTIPRNDASPPDRKRLRRSPLEQPAVPPYVMTTQTPAQPGQPPQMGGSQPMMVGIQPGQGIPPGQGMMVRPPVIGPPGAGLNTGVPSGPQHAGQPPMGTPMMNIGGQPMGMVMNSHMQMQREQFRAQQPASAMGAKPGMPHPGVPMPGVPGNAGSPPSTDPSTFNIGGPGPTGGPAFNPAAVGPANRIGGPQNKMMPPPSPAVNGPPKDQSSAAPPGAAGPGRPDTKAQAGGATNPDGSPRNQALPNAGANAGQTPNQPSTAPPTPGPGPSQPPQPGQQGASGPAQTPGTTQPPNLQSMAPSPSSILGGPSGMTGQSLMPDPMSGNIFSTDFIQSVASSLDEFDPTLFRPDGDINFERDFGQWFNPDDVTGPLDAMK